MLMLLNKLDFFSSKIYPSMKVIKWVEWLFLLWLFWYQHQQSRFVCLEGWGGEFIGKLFSIISMNWLIGLESLMRKSPNLIKISHCSHFWRPKWGPKEAQTSLRRGPMPDKAKMRAKGGTLRKKLGPKEAHRRPNSCQIDPNWAQLYPKLVLFWTY
jgi:hypothetical protein